MIRKLQSVNQKELEIVYKAIEDYILVSHKLCSIDEITKETALSKRKCKRIIDKLLSDNKVTIVYEGKGKPTLYIPTYMFDEILRSQHKPDWISKYTFSEKIKKLNQIEKIKQEIIHYEIIERLLYGTGIPLEEAVAYCLRYLGFKNVQHHKEKDSHDISFTYNGIQYLLEIEGTTKQGNKNKVSQLRGWIEMEVDKGKDPSKIVGIFVVNHFRDKDPKDREYPLTDHAIRYLKLYHLKFFTTYFLFTIMKNVINNNLSKSEAREELIKGENYP